MTECHVGKSSSARSDKHINTERQQHIFTFLSLVGYLYPAWIGMHHCNLGSLANQIAVLLKIFYQWNRPIFCIINQIKVTVNLPDKLRIIEKLIFCNVCMLDQPSVNVNATGEILCLFVVLNQWVLSINSLNLGNILSVAAIQFWNFQGNVANASYLLSQVYGSGASIIFEILHEG